jgi:hypothetical protein
MDRYRIIGKTQQITSMYLKDKKTNILKQHRIILGKQVEVDEDELTFHVARLLAKKQIQLLKLGEKPEVVTSLDFFSNASGESSFVTEQTPGVGVIETQSLEAVSPTRRRRGRKKKSL